MPARSTPSPATRGLPFVDRLRTPWVSGLLVFCGVLSVLAAAWNPFAPVRLFDFDAANFALALESFQPAAHQPQPPGYPLYVALSNLIHAVVPDVALTFLIAGLLGAATAVSILWVLGRRMLGWRAGTFAGLLLMTNPILWQTGMSDQVRIYIAVISIAVALAVWPGWAGPLTQRRLVVAGLLLGLLAGFRPEMLVSMAPLLLIAALRSRLRIDAYLWGALATCAGMAPWFIVLLIRVGGPSGFLAMLRVYSAEQASGSSVLFGAGWGAAWKMVGAAFWWASLGVAAWSPALLMVRWQKIGMAHRAQAWFLLTWFLALFLFSIAVHIAASGHALGFIPVLCLAGGWLIAAVGDTRGRVLEILCLMVALSLNVYFFFRPYAPEVREASYQTVGGIGDVNDAALEGIDRITQSRPAFLVSDDAYVSWRILQYYYPKTPLIYIPAPLAKANLPVWLIQNHLRVRDLDANTELPLPSCGSIVWLVTDSQSKQKLLAFKGADDERYFITTPAQPGMHFTVGRYRLATSPQPCPASH